MSVLLKRVWLRPDAGIFHIWLSLATLCLISSLDFVFTRQVKAYGMLKNSNWDPELVCLTFAKCISELCIQMSADGDVTRSDFGRGWFKSAKSTKFATKTTSERNPGSSTRVYCWPWSHPSKQNLEIVTKASKSGSKSFASCLTTTIVSADWECMNISASFFVQISCT